MSITLLGFTLDVIGKIMVAYAALRVHHRVWRERRMDAVIFRAMRREQWVGIIGITLIVAGYLLQLPSKF